MCRLFVPEQPGNAGSPARNGRSWSEQCRKAALVAPVACPRPLDRAPVRTARAIRVAPFAGAGASGPRRAPACCPTAAGHRFASLLPCTLAFHDGDVAIDRQILEAFHTAARLRPLYLQPV